MSVTERDWYLNLSSVAKVLFIRTAKHSPLCEAPAQKREAGFSALS